MQIESNEVESVKVVGQLNDEDVKIIRTNGGFNMAVGKRRKGAKVELLAAGSHPGLVVHQLTKEFKNSFQPAIYKSETEQMEEVKEYTNILPNELVKDGFEVFAIEKNGKTDMIITRYGVTIGQCPIKENK